MAHQFLDLLLEKLNDPEFFKHIVLEEFLEGFLNGVMSVVKPESK